MRKSKVCLVLTSAIPTHSWEFGEKALGILYAGDPRLRPDRVGLDDTDLRKKLPCAMVQDLRPLWASGPGAGQGEGVPTEALSDLFWRRWKPLQAEGTFGQTWVNQKGSTLPSWVHLSSNFRPDIDFLSLFREWCLLYTPDQAYLHMFGPEELAVDTSYTLTIEEVRNGTRTPEMLQKDAWRTFKLGSFGALWDQKRYNLGAINYFPPGFLSPDTVSSLQGQGLSVDDLGGGTLLWLCETLQDVKDDFPEFSRKRALAKQIIGPDLFEIRDEPA
ncbi:hypothetical protein SAMN05216196_101588 [Lutimaribacter pacificus]|uniref:Uncharacterized protein n=1 Tax=Lutimaribacter pacificus TaxID=391948 RepID=A0A1H0BIK4_9RHOB|nr:hypothetical protein [Lutimaribacter pacificus]SDN45472.1 hypothetical protein SAMN05216196_101588 [Lutimaribacter pacificus]SHJ55714.1 hypothetical protein SAMN05444142_101629 [Lutimaribacter pacificus]